MIDWLRGANTQPTLALANRELPVEIRRHPRARRMTLRLAPDGSAVRVTLPNWGRTAEALAFAQQKAEWLERQLASLPCKDPPGPGSRIHYRGEQFTIAWAASAPRRPAVEEGQVVLGGPEGSIARRLQQWLEGEALELMQADLGDYCARAGLERPDLRLSRAQRRWGSCSGNGTIRINWRLVQAPDMVRRSVVAHEVAHLVHFDHGPKFHALLSELFEDGIETANRWLKREGRSLYASFG